MFIMHFGRQQLNREINYINQFAYEILYIIMKIWPCITPIMIFFLHSVPTATH